MYNYPQYIYPPTTVPVQRYFANPYVRTNEYDLGGLIGGIGDKLGGVFGGQNGSLMSGLGKVGITGGILGGIGSAVGNLGNKAISGGLSSGAGKAISGIGNAVGGIVGKVNPVLGAAVSAASGIIGGLTNRAFGSKLNDAAISAINSDISSINDTRVSDSSNESIANQAAAQNWGGAFDKSTVGKDGWFANKAQKEFEKLQRGMSSAQNYAAANYDNAATNVSKNMMNNLLMNSAAFGGYFDNPFSHPGSGAIAYGLEQQNLANQQQLIGQQAQQQYNNQYACGGNLHCFGGRLFSYGGPTNPHGSDFSNGLVYIENGGTHEENPYQGVPMGADSKGIPNVVEEGEIIVPKKLLGNGGASDYVLSNRIVISPEFAQKYKLGGDLTIAEAAKKLTKESRENPNDPILEQTTAKLMQEMVQMQEQIKAEQQQRQMMQREAAIQAIQNNPYEQEVVVGEPNIQGGVDLNSAAQEQEAMQLQGPGMAFGGRMYSGGGFFPNVNILAYGNNFNDGVTQQQAWEAIMLPEFMRRLQSEIGADGADVTAIIDRYNRLQDLYKTAGMLGYNGAVIRNDNIKPLQQYFYDLGMNSAFNNDLISKYYNPSTHGGRTSDQYDNFSPDGVGGGYTALRTLGVGDLSDSAVTSMNDAINGYGVEYYKDNDGLWRLRQIQNEPAATIDNDGYLFDEKSGEYIGPELRKDQYLTESQLEGFEDAIDSQNNASPYNRGFELLPTWQRNVPLWMSGIATLMDRLGITNRPDYSNAATLEALADSQRAYMPVSFKQAGERMGFDLTDPYQTMITNDAGTSSRSRYIQDNSNGNGALANASQVALDRNAALANGQLGLQGHMYNQNNYDKMLEFNLGADLQNSQGIMGADIQNAHNWRLGQGAHSQLMSQALAMRMQEKQAADAARALNMSNFIKGMSNYGKENAYINMVNSNPANSGYGYRDRRFGVDYNSPFFNLPR